MSYAAELRKWQSAAKLLPTKVVGELRPVGPSDLFSGQLYHVSTDPKIKGFIPQVSRRTLEKEDMRVPRICTAPGIVGCLIAYGAIWADYYENRADWTIYSFDWELAFEPSKRLLPDQLRTDEHWLLTYSPETREYHGRKVGKLRCVAYQSRRLGVTATNRMEFALEVSKGESVWWGDSCECREGYWSVILDGWEDGKPTIKKVKAQATQIDQKTYQQLVGAKVTMLARVEPVTRAW